MLTDLRYAFRILAKNPAFAAVAILSLALGIGANTAIFTLVDYVMLRALPVRAPEQLAVLARNPEKPSTGFNYPDYVYIRDHNRSYSGVIASSGGGGNWAGVHGGGQRDGGSPPVRHSLVRPVAAPLRRRQGRARARHHAQWR